MRRKKKGFPILVTNQTNPKDNGIRYVSKQTYERILWNMDYNKHGEKEHPNKAY